MYILNGKTLVFTDQHFGVKGNSQLRQKIGALVIKKILDAIEKDNIDNIIFCGDYFHQRNALTVDTLNIAYRCLQALAKHCSVYMILGNHDLFNKNSTDVNSINIFRDNNNIYVIDKPAEAELNGKLVLFVPWLADLSSFKTESYDFMFGHFDISSKFLVSSYVQEHSRCMASSDNTSTMIDDDCCLEVTDNESKRPEDFLGSFIELSKKNGAIFAGHIHQHKEMTVRGRKFIFVGSPYEQNLGDIGCRCGFYEIDDIGNYSFYEIDGIPKHIQFKTSDIKKCGIDRYDFSCAKGNIVQKVYDEDISIEDDLKINQKIASFNPYEELLPDYQVALDFASDNVEQHNNFVKMLKKSKLEYVNSYINQLDNKVLEDSNIEKPKLFSIMKKYYNDVSGEE